MEVSVDHKKFVVNSKSNNLTSILSDLFSNYNLGSPFKYAIVLNGELIPKRKIENILTLSSDKI